MDRNLATPSSGAEHARRPTGFVHHPSFELHDTGRGHPERAARLAAVNDRLARSGLLATLDRLEPDPAPVAVIARVHDEEHVRRVERACAAGVRVLDAGDTTVSRESYGAALLAAGGA